MKGESKSIELILNGYEQTTRMRKLLLIGVIFCISSCTSNLNSNTLNRNQHKQLNCNTTVVNLENDTSQDCLEIKNEFFASSVVDYFSSSPNNMSVNDITKMANGLNENFNDTWRFLKMIKKSCVNNNDPKCIKYTIFSLQISATNTIILENYINNHF